MCLFQRYDADVAAAVDKALEKAKRDASAAGYAEGAAKVGRGGGGAQRAHRGAPR